MWWTAIAWGAPAWLEGCWEPREATCQEVWLPGGVGATSCTDPETGASTWEHLWVGVDDGVEVYRASPSGQSTTTFTAVETDDEQWTWENPGHDFPQRIRYRRTGTGLLARVETLAGEGFTWTLRPCGEGPPAPPPPQVPACVHGSTAASRALRAAATRHRRDTRDRERGSLGVGALVAPFDVGVARAAVAAGAICTPDDATRAADLLRVGGSQADAELAYHVAGWACDRGDRANCERAAGAWDLARLKQDGHQWFGTIVVFSRKTGEPVPCLPPIDPGATDDDRARFGTPMLADVVEGMYPFGGREAPEFPTYEQLLSDGGVCGVPAAAPTPPPP